SQALLAGGSGGRRLARAAAVALPGSVAGGGARGALHGQDPGDLGGGQRLRAAVHRPARRAHAARAVEGDADDDQVGAGAAAASHAQAPLAAEVIEPAALVVGEGAGAATGAAVGGHL